MSGYEPSLAFQGDTPAASRDDPSIIRLQPASPIAASFR
jgi:hypothetical protein